MSDDGTVTINITAEALNAAISQALYETVREQLAEDEYIRAALEPMVEDAIEKQRIELEDLVRLTVSAYAPTNANIKAVIADVQKHLDRYPSLADDIGMQNVVGKAINDYMMKRL